jgi:hypothetical protein
MSDPNATVTKQPTEARQGTTRPKTIYVLIVSVALVAIVFAAVWLTQRG